MEMTKVSHWVRQHRFSRGVGWFLFSTILLTGTTYADLTDNAIHAPPTTGPFAYNAFKPGAPGFPAVGGTYTDPVFGGVIKRLSDITGSFNDDDIYSHHWANANGTLAFVKGPIDTDIVEIATGNRVYTGQPDGSSRTDLAFDALDPNVYYFYQGVNLMRRNLAAQTSTVKKAFPSALQMNGGSLNTQSRDGRYFTVRYSVGGTNANVLWDSQTDEIYSGSVPPLKLTGWTSITPDAKYMVVAAGTTPEPQTEHWSYPINHVNKSIGSTPTQFWGLCGAHGVLSSASNGKNYYIGLDCYTGPGAIYRVDITLDQAGNTPNQQLNTNQLLLPLTVHDDVHLSAVSKGALADWVFVSTESNQDDFNGGVSGWTAHKQELIAVNIVTLEVRRLAHHRSRAPLSEYYYQPRVSCSWDGSVVMWTSNYNISSPSGYADLYAMQSPLGARIAPPQNLRFK